jgi:DNA repair protein RecO (recombination protein O)
MLHKTRGIILKSTPYSESSLVIHIYTELFGTQSYLLQGVRKNKSKIRLSMLQNLQLVDMVVYHKENGGLQRISELKASPVFQSIPLNIVKTSLVLFICELLHNTLREQHQDENLFDFLFQSIELLDLTDGNVANFHLWFLLRYSQHLGFYPQNNITEQSKYFDMREASYVSSIPTHPAFLDETSTIILSHLQNNTWEDIRVLKLTKEQRKQMLLQLLNYYAAHIENFKALNSHHILEEIM